MNRFELLLDELRKRAAGIAVPAVKDEASNKKTMLPKEELPPEIRMPFSSEPRPIEEPWRHSN